MKVQITASEHAPERGIRKKGVYSNLLRRLQQGQTATLTYDTPEEAEKAMNVVRQSAIKIGIKVEMYRPKGETHKLCIAKMSGPTITGDANNGSGQ